MFYDNEDVYKNKSTPEPTLKKWSVIIFHHKCTEAVSAGVSRTAKEGTATNLADLFTKMLAQIRRETMLENFTYWFIWDVVLSDRRESGFITKKEFTTSFLSGGGEWIWFFCMVKSIMRCIRIVYPENQVDGNKRN